MKYKHIFGPVPSRRLGISLGIDLVPFKTCNLNCIYCECGFTTNHTNIRKNYADFNEIIAELKDYLSNNPELDYITFSGAGEPLLNINIGKIVDFLKTNYPKYRLALLTNGLLLSDRQVLEDIKNIDLLIPSLDAGSNEVFQKINHPVKSVDFNSYIEALINIRKNFKNQLWLETFLIKDINDNSKELKLISNIIEKISPDKVQLNTIDRPPAVKGIKGLNYKEIMEAKKHFSGNIEIIKNFSSCQPIWIYTVPVAISNLLFSQQKSLNINMLLGFFFFFFEISLTKELRIS